MKTIVLANAKGGTGKTTTAVTLAACFAHTHGKRVLAIDLDSQGNLGRAITVTRCCASGCARSAPGMTSW